MPPLTSMEVEFTENRIIDLIDFLVDEVNRRLELDYQDYLADLQTQIPAPPVIPALPIIPAPRVVSTQKLFTTPIKLDPELREKLRKETEKNLESWDTSSERKSCSLLKRKTPKKLIIKKRPRTSSPAPPQ